MTTATAIATAQYPEEDIAAAIARALVAARDRPDPGPDGSRSAPQYAGYGPGLPRQRLETPGRRRPAPGI